MSKKQDDEVYILRLTRDQELIIEQACELLARLHIGQFEQIPFFLEDHASSVDDWCRKRDYARKALDLSACLLFGMNMYGNPDCRKTEGFHRAWSVYEVLRYHRSWYDHPDGGFGVCFDKPMNLNGEPLPKCMIEKEGVIIDDGRCDH